MFHHVIFCLELLSTNMTRILILYDYPCGKEVSDNVHTANRSNQNNAGASLIRCQALGRPAWNSLSEEQRWHPTVVRLLLFHWKSISLYTFLNINNQFRTQDNWLVWLFPSQHSFWEPGQAVQHERDSTKVTLQRHNCTALHWIALHLSSLHCTALNSTALLCTALH